jgi:signal transduction histidine kinase
VQLRDQFLSTASHELRTPITSLKLRMESLLRMASSKVQPATAYYETVDRALTSTKRLQRLVEELLDVRRVEQGQMTLTLSEVDLVMLVSAAAEQVELELAQAGASLSVVAPGKVAGIWDARRLEQVVTNLLTNAIKFGAGKPIEVTVREVGVHAELTVTDHGIGIDPARLPHVFDRFERAVSTAHYPGLGLGLYLARSIVESHGGTIRVDSQVGQGSTFTVRLPRRPQT